MSWTGRQLLFLFVFQSSDKRAGWETTSINANEVMPKENKIHNAFFLSVRGPCNVGMCSTALGHHCLIGSVEYSMERALPCLLFSLPSLCALSPPPGLCTSPTSLPIQAPGPPISKSHHTQWPADQPRARNTLFFAAAARLQRRIVRGDRKGGEMDYKREGRRTKPASTFHHVRHRDALQRALGCEAIGRECAVVCVDEQCEWPGRCVNIVTVNRGKQWPKTVGKDSPK